MMILSRIAMNRERVLLALEIDIPLSSLSASGVSSQEMMRTSGRCISGGSSRCISSGSISTSRSRSISTSEIVLSISQAVCGKQYNFPVILSKEMMYFLSKNKFDFKKKLQRHRLCYKRSCENGVNT